MDLGKLFGRKKRSNEPEGGKEAQGFAPELYTQEELAAVEAHVARYFGPYDNVFHEIVSLDIHLDVLIMKPTAERDHYILMTQGMGAHRMTMPQGMEDASLDRAELMICLPAHWQIDGQEERWYWPIRWLKILGRLPLEHDTWLGWGHTIPTGEPIEGTPFTCMLLLGPQDREEGAGVCDLPDGSQVHFYQIVPLYEQEMQFKLDNGTEALLERMADVDHAVDPDRPNACAGVESENPGGVLEIELEQQIRPFFWVRQAEGASVCLEAGEYLQSLFETRAEEGFLGNGYDWASLAQVFLQERLPQLQERIEFDPEAGMFSAYSSDTDALRTFILDFQAACQDQALIADLFSRAEVD